MVPTTFSAVVILLLAIAPGYLATAVWARAKTWKGFGSDLDTVLRSLAASLLIQIPMFPLAVLLGLYPNVAGWHRHNLALLAWLLLSVLAVPILGGASASWVYDKFLFPLARDPDPRTSTVFWAPQFPSAWDRFFIQTVPSGSWLILDLDDGTHVAGSWEVGSFARTTPASHGLYLRRQWQVDDEGNLLPDPVPHTGGILIEDSSKIRRIRIITP